MYIIIQNHITPSTTRSIPPVFRCLKQSTHVAQVHIVPTTALHLPLISSNSPLIQRQPQNTGQTCLL